MDGLIGLTCDTATIFTGGACPAGFFVVDEWVMRFEVRNPDFESKVRTSFGGQAFMSLVGARLAHVAPGEVDIAFDFRPELTQQKGFVHGGVTASIADTSAGYAALTLFDANSEVMTTEYKVNLLAPAQGDAFVARGRVIRSGRTLSVCQSDVFALDGGNETLILTGLFTMMQVAM